MPSLSTHEDTSSQFAKREKIAAPLVKAIGTFFAVTGPRNVPGSLVPHGPTTRPLAGPKQVKMAAPRSNETQENARAFKSA